MLMIILGHLFQNNNKYIFHQFLLFQTHQLRQLEYLFLKNHLKKVYFMMKLFHLTYLLKHQKYKIFLKPKALLNPITNYFFYDFSHINLYIYL